MEQSQYEEAKCRKDMRGGEHNDKDTQLTNYFRVL